MGTGTEYIVPMVISLAASAASTGISMYSQGEQAKTAQRMAEYNAAVQRQDAEVQARLAQYQASSNAQIAQAQAQAQINNAQSLANQALGMEAQQRERARRLRDEKARLLAGQRAKFAKSGVTAEGTPLVVLAESSQLSDLNIHDAQYESELQRQGLLRQSELTRFESGFSLLEAEQQRYQGLAAQASQRIRNRQADLTQLAGAAEASTYGAKAAATLISGLGSMTEGGYDYYYKSRQWKVNGASAKATTSLNATGSTG